MEPAEQESKRDSRQLQSIADSSITADLHEHLTSDFFLVDGDALLTAILDSPAFRGESAENVSPLSVLYCFEAFLSRILGPPRESTSSGIARERYRIVFVQENRRLWEPAAQHARSVLISHLRKELDCIEVLAAATTPQFLDDVESSRPNVLFTRLEFSHTSPFYSDHLVHAIKLAAAKALAGPVKVTLSLLSSVGTLGVTTTSGRLQAQHVVPLRGDAAHSLLQSIQGVEVELTGVYDKFNGKELVDVPKDLEVVDQTGTLRFLALVCKELLKADDSQETKFFCKIAILQAAILPFLPLRLRRRPFRVSASPRSFMQQLLTNISQAIECLPPASCQVLDIFDARVFLALAKAAATHPSASLLDLMFEGEKVAPAVRESILGAVSVAKEAWNTVVKGDDLESLTVDAQLSEDSIAFLDNKSSAGGTSTIPTLESDFAKKVLGGTSSLFSFTSLSGKPLQPLIELPDPVSLEQDMEVTEEEEVDDSVLTEEKARSDILKMCISIAENIQRTNKVTLYPKIPSTLEEFEAKPKSYESVAVEVLGRFRMRKMIPDIKFKPGPKITKRLVQVKLGKQGQREQRAKQIEVMYSEHRARFEDRDPVRVEVGKFQATATQATATSKKDLQRKNQRNALLHLHEVINNLEQTLRLHLLPKAKQAAGGEEKKDQAEFRPRVPEARVTVSRFVSQGDMPFRRRDKDWTLIQEFADQRKWEGETIASFRACILFLRVVAAEWFSARHQWNENKKLLETQSTQEKALDLILRETKQVLNNRVDRRIEEAREQMEAKGLHCKKVIDEVLKVFGRHFLGSQIESSIEAKMNIFDARQKEATEEFTFPRSLSFLLTLLASLGHQDEATKIFKELNSKIRSSIKIEQLPEDDHVEAWNKLMEIGWTTPEKSEKEQLSFLEFKKLHDEIMARGEGWKAEVQRLMSESKQSVKEEKEASSETESKETEPSDVILTTVEKAEAAAGFTFAGIADLWKRFSRALVGESEFESGTESAATYIGNVISLLRSMGVPEAADAFYARLQPAFQKAKAVAQANETKTVRGWVPGIRTVKAAAMVLPPTQTVEPKTTAADKDYSKLLSFAIAQAIVDASQKSPTLSSSDFQLLCADQYLRRTEGLLDSRMEPLHLDDWQRKMLDVVDEGRSGLIVAPTSAGKSFISYYVVKKILEENPDATICFVVPTKALVNQIVVDTQTRLRILRQAGGRNPAGIFTQEMRTQELNSNILITVPECLEMCYLDTNRSDSWTPSVQYAVLDEVHNLHGRNGAIWERLLLFGSIPFLAMSATVGNAQEIYSWLRKARRDTDLAPVIDASDTAAGPSKNATTGNSESEKKDLEELGIDISLGDSDEEDLEMTIEDDESAGDADAKEEEKEAVKAETVEGKAEDREVKDANVVELIQHNIRWNDLIFHVWSPEKGLVPVSPLAGLTVEDIALGHQSLYSTRLTPRQAVVFYQVLMEATRELKMDSPKLEPLKLALEALYPPKWFGNRGVDMIKLSETYEYERNVKACLQYMARLEPGVVRAMLAKMHVGIQEAVAPLMKSVEDAESTEEFMKTYLLNYLFSMKNLNRFPIICFALDNNMLVTLAKQMATALRSMENDYKEKKYGENWRDIINKRIAETETAIANLETKFTSLPPSQRNNPHNEVNERLSEKRTELAYLRNSLTHMDEFCFGRLTEEEVAEALFMKLYRSNRAAAVKKVKEPPMDEDMTLRAALLRGIGVHHEAMPYRYRAAVEDLFGGRRLAVVLATNTLAQGINMPCRTVTFLMDSPYLNGINFQQMSGRAGRRGFDYRGEVVFLALPERKLLRLITSPPPLLRGNSLLDATSLLRLQQSYSNAPSKAVKERLVEWVRRMMHYPFLSSEEGRGTIELQLQYHVAFLFAMMQRSGYLTQHGTLRDDTMIASHMWYHDPANHVLQAAFFSGIIDNVWGQSKSDEDVFKLFAYLFSEEFLSHEDAAEDRQRAIAFEDMPEIVRKFLHDFHADTRALHDAFIRKYCVDHAQDLPSNTTFPLTKFTWKDGESDLPAAGIVEALGLEEETMVRAPFIPTSGNGDSFASSGELLLTARHGLHVDACPAPELPAYDLPRNSFNLSFYKGQSLAQVIESSGLDFEHLYKAAGRFQRTLKTIATVRTMVEKFSLAKSQKIKDWRASKFVESSYSPLTQCLRRISREYDECVGKAFKEYNKP